MTAFLAIEGPNGVGKSTVAAIVARLLRLSWGVPVCLTGEPTTTTLGQLVRDGESALPARAMALAVAADRALHVETEILPALHSGRAVVTDRYVPSSLVLQRLDGLSLDEIWTYNQHAPPASTFYLEHDPEEIAGRLAARPARSRLETAGGPARELQLYRDAAAFLAARGWVHEVIDCRGLDADAVAGQIAEQVRTARPPLPTQLGPAAAGGPVSHPAPE